MLPCKCVVYWAAWLYRVPAYSGAVSSIARHKSDAEIQTGGEMLALRSQWQPKENVCIPSSSWADCLHLWFLLHILCTYGHGAAWETLAWAWSQLCTGSWRPGGTVATSQQDNDITLTRRLGAVSCCISGNKETEVTNLLKGWLQWTWKGWPFLVMYRTFPSAATDCIFS